jgi:hypothetical protein
MLICRIVSAPASVLRGVMAVAASAREVPIEIIKQRRAWKTWAIVWNVVNTLMG